MRGEGQQTGSPASSVGLQADMVRTQGRGLDLGSKSRFSPCYLAGTLSKVSHLSQEVSPSVRGAVRETSHTGPSSPEQCVPA